MLKKDNKIIIKFNDKEIGLVREKIDDCEVLHILTQIIVKFSKRNGINKEDLAEIVEKYYDETE